MIIKSNKVLFYSSVKNLESFQTQKFYQIDIELMRNLGYHVQVTNQVLAFFCFWNYDISFIYFYRKGLLVAIISRFFRKNVYFTGGIDDLNKDTTPYKDYIKQKIFFKLCNLFSNRSILVSLSDQGNVKDIYSGKLPKNIDLSFHTINSELFYVNDLSIKESIFTTIVWMESIENVKRKGVDKALFVFKQLTEKDPYCDSKFFVLGKEGIGTEYLRQLCNELNISEKVIFTGSIDENLKIRYLKKSKYYFQLSTFEGFGIAALEALASKNIVIHSAKGGLKETMKNYGVILDINESVMEQMDDFYDQLSNFNLDQLSAAYDDINCCYSNIGRQKYFERILKN